MDNGEIQPQIKNLLLKIGLKSSIDLVINLINIKKFLMLD